MSEFNITVEGGSSVRLPTAGKYVDRDIIVTAEGGVEDLNTQLTEQETLITELKEILKGKASGGGVVTCNLETPSKTNTIDYLNGLSISYPNATKIGMSAFRDCIRLKSIDAPNVTYIDAFAFYSCIDITSVNLPNATFIGESSFSQCPSITNLDLPNVTEIDAQAFQLASSLKDIKLPNAAIIWDRVFVSCFSLKCIELPKALSIEEEAFNNCTSFDTLILSNTETVCNLNLTAILGTKIANEMGEPTGEGFIYVPSAFYEQYLATLTEQAYMLLVYSGYSEEEAEYMAPYIIMAILRTIEDTEQASTFGLRNPLANFKGFTKEAIKMFKQRNKALDNELGG